MPRVHDKELPKVSPRPNQKILYGGPVRIARRIACPHVLCLQSQAVLHMLPAEVSEGVPAASLAAGGQRCRARLFSLCQRSQKSRLLAMCEPSLQTQKANPCLQPRPRQTRASSQGLEPAMQCLREAMRSLTTVAGLSSPAAKRDLRAARIRRDHLGGKQRRRRSRGRYEWQ